MSSQKQRKAERRRIKSVYNELRIMREFEDLVYSKPPVWKFGAWIAWRKKVWG